VTPATAEPDAIGWLRQALASVGRPGRPALLQACIRTGLARALGLAPAAILPQTALGDLGLDSMMLLELKDTLETGLDVVLPLEAFVDDPSVSALAGRVASLLEAELAA
jgi:acyl carrier protein